MGARTAMLTLAVLSVNAAQDEPGWKLPCGYEVKTHRANQDDVEKMAKRIGKLVPYPMMQACGTRVWDRVFENSEKKLAVQRMHIDSPSEPKDRTYAFYFNDKKGQKVFSPEENGAYTTFEFQRNEEGQLEVGLEVEWDVSLSEDDLTPFVKYILQDEDAEIEEAHLDEVPHELVHTPMYKMFNWGPKQKEKDVKRYRFWRTLEHLSIAINAEGLQKHRREQAIRGGLEIQQIFITVDSEILEEYLADEE